MRAERRHHEERVKDRVFAYLLKTYNSSFSGRFGTKIATLPSNHDVERLRPEFQRLASQWRKETRHLSVAQKKTVHPAYFRIMGMGQPVVPLLLEALRDQPAHWFEALRATANADPCPPDANPSAAREAWLKWGRDRGFLD